MMLIQTGVEGEFRDEASTRQSHAVSRVEDEVIAGAPCASFVIFYCAITLIQHLQ